MRRSLRDDPVDLDKAVAMSTPVSPMSETSRSNLVSRRDRSYDWGLLMLSLTDEVRAAAS
jgi:hypothetical protein